MARGKYKKKRSRGRRGGGKARFLGPGIKPNTTEKGLALYNPGLAASSRAMIKVVEASPWNARVTKRGKVAVRVSKAPKALRTYQRARCKRKDNKVCRTTAKGIRGALHRLRKQINRL